MTQIDRNCPIQAALVREFLKKIDALEHFDPWTERAPPPAVVDANKRIEAERAFTDLVDHRKRHGC